LGKGVLGKGVLGKILDMDVLCTVRLGTVRFARRPSRVVNKEQNRLGLVNGNAVSIHHDGHHNSDFTNSVYFR